MLPGYAGYLFDLDGTLVDTAPDINAALNHALTQVELTPVGESLTRHWVGHGARVLVEQALAHHGADHDVDVLHQAFLNHYAANNSRRSQPYPHVVETLQRLRGRNARLAVVTNKLARFSVPLLRDLELLEYFEAIVSGDTAATPKPAAEPALYACEQLGLEPAQALFVGDSTPDVLCARAAGCPVVCVRDGYNHGVPAEELGADGVIESFLDLV